MREKLISLVVAIGLITGFATVWLVIGNVTKAVQVAVYGTEWLCTIIYG